jgi:hypothetical protein
MGGKTLVYDYLSEVRPLYLPRPRTLQRTVYRPGEILQFDLWAPGCEIPSGWPDASRLGGGLCAWVLARRAGTLVFSREAPDILAGL